MSHLLENEASFETKIIGFFYRQWLVYPKPIPQGTTLADQTAIVTGSNTGLGFEAARQLLQLGLSHLIVAVRSQTKGDAAAKSLRDQYPSATISVWLLDMESYESVIAFAKRCETLERIDIVLLNAGMRTMSFTLVEATRHEKTFQINYLSTVLLAILLLPVLKTKKPLSSQHPPRLSIVASDTAYWAPFSTTGPILAQCDDPSTFSSLMTYARTKLLQIYFVSRLAKEIDPNDVIVSTCNPGLCTGTDFNQKLSLGFINASFQYIFASIFGRKVEVGASALVDAVVMKGKESHGSYLSDWDIKPYAWRTYLITP